MGSDISLAYKKWADTYDNDAKWNPAILMEKGRLLPLLKLSRRDRVLEIGCGTGRVTVEIARRCRAITGIDSSEEMLSVAIQKSRRLRNVKYLKVNIQKRKLPFRAASFDKVVAPLVTNHVQNIARFFEEVRRVLKPGGIFVFDDPQPDARRFKMAHPNTLDEMFQKGKNVYLNHSLDEYVHSLHRANFEIEKIEFVRIDETMKRMLSSATFRENEGHTFGFLLRARKND